MPYSAVASVINQLDDRVYNTLPEQPEGEPSKSRSPKKQQKDKSSITSSGSKESKDKSSTSSGSTKPSPQITLSDQPPDNNPLEEPNIWATILKLEGRVYENKIAEGFQNWLRKNLDSSLFEVQKCILLHLYTF